MKPSSVILGILILNISPVWLRMHQVFQNGEGINFAQTLAGFMIVIVTVALAFIYAETKK